MPRLAFWSALLACAATSQAQPPNPYADDPTRPRVGAPSGPSRGYQGGIVENRGGYEPVPTAGGYSASTAPPPRASYAPPPPPMPPGYAYGYGGYGYPGYGYGTPAGNYLQGVASVTAATGQYYQDVQSARLTRYQANNAAIDSGMYRVKQEASYERWKRDAYKQDIEYEKKTRIDRARRDAPQGEIWSGHTFNVLLKNILDSPRPLDGPTIPLEARIVSGLNFYDKTSRGNLSMAKDEGKVEWTEGLGLKPFDTVRDRFSQKFARSISAARSGERPSRDDIADLRKDIKRLETILVDEVQNMSPGDYTSSRRQLRELASTVTGLADPAIYKTTFASKKNLLTVADVIAHCLNNGLEFGPARAEGDAQAYNTFYYFIRDYDRGVWTGGR